MLQNNVRRLQLRIRTQRRTVKKRLKIKHLRGYKLRKSLWITLVDQKRRKRYNSSIVNNKEPVYV